MILEHIFVSWKINCIFFPQLMTLEIAIILFNFFLVYEHTQTAFSGDKQ